MFPLLVISILLSLNLQHSEACVGICYNTTGKSKLSATEVVALWEKHSITQVRLYEPNHDILTALKGKNIEVMLGVPNEALIAFATNPALAESWVKANVSAYYPDVKIKYLVVGNEVSPTNSNNGFSFFLADTLGNFQTALSKDDSLKDIMLTTSFDTSILLDLRSFSASSATLAPPVLQFMDTVLKVISGTGAPVLVNIYPYYAHILNPKDMPLDYALFNGPNGSLFEAMVDTMYSALEKIGYKWIDIVVAETGWPSAGGVGASDENQKTYLTKLAEQVKKGTQNKPNKPIQTYLYSMFDEEDLQDVPEVERHWGLFTPNKELKPGAANLSFN